MPIWHGSAACRQIVAQVSLEQVCKAAGLQLSVIEAAVLHARFHQQWDSWPEAERLFGLPPGSLEPLRKRLAYWRPRLTQALGMVGGRTYRQRMKRK
jgi:hypothetical protein